MARSHFFPTSSFCIPGLRSRDAKTEPDRLCWKERAVWGWWGPQPRAEGQKGRGSGGLTRGTSHRVNAGFAISCTA